MHVLNVLKYMLLISKRMEFFNRLNDIRRVLKIFDHFWDLFNHSTLSGICQIVSIFLINNLVANQFLFKRDLLNLLYLRLLMKIERFKNTFVWYCIWFYSQEKNGEKNNKILKQIPPLLITNYFLFD